MYVWVHILPLLTLRETFGLKNSRRKNYMYANYSFSNCQHAVVQIALQLPVIYAVKSQSGKPKQKIYGYDRVDTFISPI